MKLGERLRMWRLAAGLSTTQAGRAARLNQSYICQLENGRHTPSGTALLNLAAAYGCEVAQLLTGEPELQAATAAVIMRRVDQQAAENSSRELAAAIQAANAAEKEAAAARAEFEYELSRLREQLAGLQDSTEYGFRCIESRLDTAAYVGEDKRGEYDSGEVDLSLASANEYLDQRELRYGWVEIGAGDDLYYVLSAECERRGWEKDGDIWFVADMGAAFDRLQSLEDIPLHDCDPVWRQWAGHTIYYRTVKQKGYAAAQRAYGKYANTPEGKIMKNDGCEPRNYSAARVNSMLTPEDKELRRLQKLQLGGATC